MWWQAPDDAINRAPHALPSCHNTWDVILYSYLWMVLGNKDKYLLYSKKIDKQKYRRYSFWLELEFYGRSRLFKKQAALLNKKITDSGLNFLDINALFISLSQQSVNPKYISKILKPYLVSSALSNEVSALFYYLNIVDSVSEKSSNNPFVITQQIKKSLSNGDLDRSFNYYVLLFYESSYDMGNLLQFMGLFLTNDIYRERALKVFDGARVLVPSKSMHNGCVAAIDLIHLWQTQSFKEAYAIAKGNSEFVKNDSFSKDKVTKVSWIFFNFVLRLLIFWQKNSECYKPKKYGDKRLVVIGESHSLSLNGLTLDIFGENYYAKAQLVNGVKMYHLKANINNQYTQIIKKIIDLENDQSVFIFTIGEIDTRHDEGIWKNTFKKGLDFEEVVKKVVQDYCYFIESLFVNKPNRIFIQGIPAPAYMNAIKLEADEKIPFLKMIRFVNERLREQCDRAGLIFIDVYSATVGSDGASNFKWHLDGYHLRPSLYLTQRLI